MQTKADLRQFFKKKRHDLTKEFVLAQSLIICNKINALNEFQQAIQIGFYYSAFNEVNLTPLWQIAQTLDKRTYLPIISHEKLLFAPWETTTPMKKNQFGIIEPNLPITQAIGCEQLDLILMPLVAFDHKGTRLGLGKGFYDKSLNTTPRPFLLGLGYAFQEAPLLPEDPWDIPLDAIVCESKIIYP